MKKLIITSLMMLLLGTSAIRAKAQSYMVVNNGYLLHNGQMVQVDNGNVRPVKNKILLNNGATVLPNGVIVQHDGIRRNLRNGQAIDGLGQILYPETRQDGSVVLLPSPGAVYDRNQYRNSSGGNKNMPPGNAYGRYKDRGRPNKGSSF